MFYIILMQYIETLDLPNGEREEIVESLDEVVLKFWNNQQKGVL